MFSLGAGPVVPDSLLLKPRDKVDQWAAWRSMLHSSSLYHDMVWYDLTWKHAEAAAVAHSVFSMRKKTGEADRKTDRTRHSAREREQRPFWCKVHTLLYPERPTSWPAPLPRCRHAPTTPHLPLCKTQTKPTQSDRACSVSLHSQSHPTDCLPSRCHFRETLSTAQYAVPAASLRAMPATH